jgi:hypothetical protein
MLSSTVAMGAAGGRPYAADEQRDGEDFAHEEKLLV